MLARVGRPPHMHPLHLTRSSAQSLFKPSETVISHTFSSRFPTPPFPFSSIHLQISTGGHPIIRTLTFKMTKPSWPATPHHVRHRLHIQTTIQFHTRYFVFQSHATHPPDHHFFGLLQPLHIFYFDWPSVMG